MKLIPLLSLAAAFCSALFAVPALAQEAEAPAKLLDTYTTRNGKYTIVVDSTDTPDLREWFGKTAVPKVIDWYPKIVDLILMPGDKPPTKLTLTLKNGQIMAGAPHVPAYASGNRIVVSSDFMKNEKDGEAIGCIIHEMTHVVQAGAGGNKAPGWLVEGIADYVRWFKFEPEKKGAAIKDFSKVKYNDSYRTTANFFNFVSKGDKNMIRKINHTMATGYSDEFWLKLTGKPITELEERWKKSGK